MGKLKKIEVEELVSRQNKLKARVQYSDDSLKVLAAQAELIKIEQRLEILRRPNFLFVRNNTLSLMEKLGFDFTIALSISFAQKVSGIEYAEELLSLLNFWETQDQSLVLKSFTILCQVRGIGEGHGIKQIYRIIPYPGGFNYFVDDRIITYNFVNEVHFLCDDHSNIRCISTLDGLNFGPINILTFAKTLLDVVEVGISNLVFDVSKFPKANQRKIIGDFLDLAIGNRDIDCFTSEFTVINSKKLST